MMSIGMPWVTNQLTTVAQLNSGISYLRCSCFLRKLTLCYFKQTAHTNSTEDSDTTGAQRQTPFTGSPEQDKALIHETHIRPEDLVVWFIRVLPGAYRQIAVEDVKDLTTCGPIGKYGFNGNLDPEMVRCILLYERVRQNRQRRDEIKDSEGIVHCRRCGAALGEPDRKRGRPTSIVMDVRLSGAESKTARGGEKRKQLRLEQFGFLLSPPLTNINQPAAVPPLHLSWLNYALCVCLSRLSAGLSLSPSRLNSITLFP
jgi:hypothetical protein